ncbi:Tad domain-containing protein [Chengkuizengella sp. SCS-71B]|uniref:Tad domain-containing protein n=1 Tax=Chengkuizengella sp. SCS-71B TaxID=3115290 RepID=UPI0032C20F87
MKKLKQFINEQKGSSMVMMSISMAVLIAFVGLVVDFGKVYVVKADLKKTANAAVLSGAQELMNDQANVSEVVNKILDEHGQQDKLAKTEINMENNVIVELSEEVPLTFSKIFGFENIEVPVRAKAELIKEVKYVTPLGVDDPNDPPGPVDTDYNTEYTIFSYLQSCNQNELYFRTLDLTGEGSVNDLENGVDKNEINNLGVKIYHKGEVAKILKAKIGEIIYIPKISGSGEILGYDYFKITNVLKLNGHDFKSWDFNNFKLNFKIIGYFIPPEDVGNGEEGDGNEISKNEGTEKEGNEEVSEIVYKIRLAE